MFISLLDDLMIILQNWDGVKRERERDDLEIKDSYIFISLTFLCFNLICYVDRFPSLVVIASLSSVIWHFVSAWKYIPCPALCTLTHSLIFLSTESLFLPVRARWGKDFQLLQGVHKKRIF